MARLIDLSHRIEPYSKNHYQQQAALAKTTIEPFWTYEDFGFYDCIITMSDHAGTHVDAPIHFNPKGRSIDETPLETLTGEAVIFDMSHKPALADILPKDLEEAVERQRIELAGARIALISSGRYRLYGTRDYHWDILNMSVEATEWCLEHGMNVVGCDMACWECDRVRFQLDPRLKPWAAERYPAHCLQKKYDLYIIENLANLDRVPKNRFYFMGLPLPFAGASGSPIRAVALLEE